MQMMQIFFTDIHKIDNIEIGDVEEFIYISSNNVYLNQQQ